MVEESGNPAASEYLSVYGTRNVSVRQEWMSSAEEHYPMDVGLYIDTINHSNPYFKVCVGPHIFY